MIKTENLRFSYHSSKVLRDISFASEAGHFIALLGNNGTGKSTLLKCLSGLLPTGSGTVYACGRDLTRMNRRETARTMAYVEQSCELSRLTVYDVVLMGRKPYITLGPSQEDIAIVERTLARLHLQDYSMRYVDELSGGELQKVAIARAVAQCPKVLLLDEPTSSLDLRNQHEVMALAADLAYTDGILVITVIHDLNLALRYCDRYLLLDQGEICGYGDQSVITPETLERVYHVRTHVLDIEGIKTVIVSGMSPQTVPGREETKKKPAYSGLSGYFEKPNRRVPGLEGGLS